MPEAMSAIPLQDALEACSEAWAQQAAAMLRSGEAHASSSLVKYADLMDTLRVRLEIKRNQATAGNRNVICLRDAMATIVAWWDAHSDEQVLYDHVSTESDVAFILWRSEVTGTVLAGFETRDATRLTPERGKEFWGPDWQAPFTGL